MPSLLITGPERSGKTNVACGLLAWLRDAGCTATYAKPFSATARLTSTTPLRPAG